MDACNNAYTIREKLTNPLPTRNIAPNQRGNIGKFAKTRVKTMIFCTAAARRAGECNEEPWPWQPGMCHTSHVAAITREHAAGLKRAGLKRAGTRSPIRNRRGLPPGASLHFLARPHKLYSQAKPRAYIII